MLDADGSAIGLLEKDFAQVAAAQPLARRDAAGNELLEAQEASWPIALVRRVAGIVSDWFWRCCSGCRSTSSSRARARRSGTTSRVLGQFRDRYVLELGPGAEGIDRRLLLAFAVALDALQDR